MSIQEVSAEELAKLFHLYHQALAHGLDDYRTGGHGTAERKRMVAAARLALIDLAAADSKELTNRSYFAKPGEADWGC